MLYCQHNLHHKAFFILSSAILSRLGFGQGRVGLGGGCCPSDSGFGLELPGPGPTLMDTDSPTGLVLAGFHRPDSDIANDE